MVALSLPERTLCLFSCWARIVVPVQHAVPVALRGGVERGIPVPILPECVVGRASGWWWLLTRPCQTELCPTCQGNAELPPLLLLPS